jgi:hypothetical protein
MPTPEEVQRAVAEDAVEGQINEIRELITAHLRERTATLFLGAGINAGTTRSDGVEFPLAAELGQWICRDLLDDGNLKLPLDQAADIARYKLGEKPVNQYLFEQFGAYRPSAAHLSLVQLPWDVIYTTNYDLLVEQAAAHKSIVPAGTLKTIFSTSTELDAFSEADILYYKLHGSVDFANTDEGRLILTKEDYRFYERFRKPLFHRLERDLLSRTFVFIGYSLQDPNFQAILNDCREQLGAKTLPLSYAVRRDFSEVEATFWREKYNIQLIAGDSASFLSGLQRHWETSGGRVVPFVERAAKVYTQVDSSTRLSRIGSSFYRVVPADCTGASDPQLFFKGVEPSWADIRDHIAPARDEYWTIMEALFSDLIEPSASVSVYLVTGHAGTGKTTLVRSLAYDVAHDFASIVLVHIPDTPLDARVLGPLVGEGNPERIIVIVHHAADYAKELERFAEDIKRLQLPVSIILEERRNQWHVAASTVARRLNAAEFELGSLSEGEIDRILSALTSANALGKLTGMSAAYQKQHFQALADKELLVALRELTSEGSFDQIVRDEYSHIPSALAQKAYVYVAALGQINLALRYANLISILDLDWNQLGKEILRPADGVLISGEVAGSSRHNASFCLRARHPVIASIIFAEAAKDDRDKFVIINDIISELDPGYPEDRRLLEEIVRRKEIVNTLASPENRRAIYDRLQAVLPGNAFVLQHRSILERDLGQPELAIKYAREAVAIERSNPVLLNTLGMALEFAARSLGDPLRRQAYLREAEKLFDDGIKRNPHDPYAYVGKANLLKQRIEDEPVEERRGVLKASALSLLEEAHEVTDESPIIGGQLAEFREELGEANEATKILRGALEKKPNDSRLRDLLIQFVMEQGRFADALKIALDGIQYDPTSWRLLRHAARLMIVLGKPVEAIKGHYEAAIRNRKGDVALAVELGAYLFINGRSSEAAVVFSQAKDLPVPAYEKRRIREWWRDERGQRRVFTGRVKSIRSGTAVALAVPENFDAFFWRTRSELSGLRVGDDISFDVGFNAHGAIADRVRPKQLKKQ